jgi:hypothetical protein
VEAEVLSEKVELGQWSEGSAFFMVLVYALGTD